MHFAVYLSLVYFVFLINVGRGGEKLASATWVKWCKIFVVF